MLRLLLVVLCAGNGVAAFEPTLDPRLVDEAIAIGQSRIEAVHTRYHQPYRIRVARSPIDYIDVVTPFRRVALLAEERARAGDRRFGQRAAITALGDGPALLEFLVEMTFHPLNVFIGVPAYDVELVEASSTIPIHPLRFARVPRAGARVEGAPPPSPYPQFPGMLGGSQPLAGGTIVAGFDAGALNPTGGYDVVVSEKGKELARARVNLGILR